MSAHKKKKNINLLPREDFDRTTLGRVLKWALTTFRYIVITVELIVVAGFLSRFYFDVQIGNLNEDIKQRSAAVAARYPFELSFRNAQQKLSILSSVGSTQNSFIPIIDFISEVIPADMQLISISKKDSTLNMKVATLSETSALKLLNSFRKNDAFSGVAITRVEANEDSPFTFYTLEGEINFDAIKS